MYIYNVKILKRMVRTGTEPRSENGNEYRTQPLPLFSKGRGMSFVPVSEDSHFPIQNLPYGVFSTAANVSAIAKNDQKFVINFV